MGKCLSKSKQPKSDPIPPIHNYHHPPFMGNQANIPTNNHPRVISQYPQTYIRSGSIMPPHIQYPQDSAQSHIAMSPPHVVYQPHDRFTRVKALFAYSARNDDDLDFNAGDILYVSSNLSDDWWLARHSKTKRQGYIPSNYVVIDNGGPESHEAWYNISRRDADRKLLMVGNPKGTYIIRPSSCPNTYALSIRHYDDIKDSWVVKHYKIRKNDEGGYFISARRNFSYILDLLDFYKGNPDGLCCKLSIPCPRTYKPPVQFRDFEVNRDCIQKIKFIGKGSFGEVFLAKWNNSIEVAVKTHLPTSNTATFLEEARTMHRLHHPRIVQLLGVCTKPESEPVFIITELMSKGALVDFLRKPESRSLSLNDFIDFMAQITDGMAYLESQNSIHRDLRAANILVDCDNSVKVSDFGLAKFLKDPNSNETTIKFPIKWTAPEAANQHQFSTKSDVWSFGVLMYEIVTYGGTPYHQYSNKQVIAEIEKGYRMPNPNSEDTPCSDDLYKIMLECWKSRPEQRPTFRHLHEVFDNWASHNETQYHD